jgi:phenylacetic acid degradation operon negative regulatory protein
MALSPATSDLLRTGADRIYGFGEDRSWDGEWLVVVVRVPEAQREIRHQMRTRLAWAGLGSLGGGVWITPRVEREEEVVAIAAGDGVAEVVSFRGAMSALGEPRRMVAAAWDLDSVRSAYDDFVGLFSGAHAGTPAETFAAQSAMVHAWRKFPFLDPELPRELLDAAWPRVLAHQVFQEQHARWAKGAHAHFEALEAGILAPNAA